MSNEYDEQRARYVPAMRLARHFQQRGLSMGDVERMHPMMRQHHAKMVGIDPLEAETVLSTMHKLYRPPSLEEE